MRVESNADTDVYISYVGECRITQAHLARATIGATERAVVSACFELGLRSGHSANSPSITQNRHASDHGEFRTMT